MPNGCFRRVITSHDLLIFSILGSRNSNQQLRITYPINVILIEHRVYVWLWYSLFCLVQGSNSLHSQRSNGHHVLQWERK